VPNNQTLPVPLVAHSQSERTIQFIPLLIGLGITTGIGTGIEGIASSAAYYNQLSTELTNDTEQVAKSIMTMQDQLDSLTSVVLQNWRELDLLIAKKGRALPSLKQRVLLLCKSVRNSQRYGSAIAGLSHT
jgi:hypothetical protein